MGVQIVLAAGPRAFINGALQFEPFGVISVSLALTSAPGYPLFDIDSAGVGVNIGGGTTLSVTKPDSTTDTFPMSGMIAIVGTGALDANPGLWLVQVLDSLSNPISPIYQVMSHMPEATTRQFDSAATAMLYNVGATTLYHTIVVDGTGTPTSDYTAIRGRGPLTLGAP